MTPLMTITTNLELNPWDDLDLAKLNAELMPNGATAKLERVGVLPNATKEGRAGVALLIRLPDGRQVIAETTLRLFNAASAAVAATPIAQLENQ